MGIDREWWKEAVVYQVYLRSFTDSDGEPWIPVNPNDESINVEDATARENSVWHYYRDLVEFRQDNDVAVYGDYDLLLADDSDIYAYLRSTTSACWSC